MMTILFYCFTHAYGVSCNTVEFPTPQACLTAKQVWYDKTKGVKTLEMCISKVTGQEIK